MPDEELSGPGSAEMQSDNPIKAIDLSQSLAKVKDVTSGVRSRIFT